MLYRNLGIEAVVNEISKKKKFWRNKDMAVRRWPSVRVREIIVRFPATLNL